MNAEEEKFRSLLKNYQAGLCTKEEVDWLESWYLRWNEKDKVPLSREELDDVRDAIRITVERQTRQALVHRFWPKAAAAAVILAAGLMLYFHSSQNAQVSELQAESGRHDIAPGRNKATLTLADGRHIDLSTDKEGIALRAGELTYNDGTRLESDIRTEYVILSTPAGGQYQAILPDSTKVWLNAASSLKYPASFTGLEERRVELDGEAYFEVTRDEEQPFRVVTRMQEVEVLGTRFNVNSYADEPKTVTTLVEGSVRVSAANREPKLLAPGQQSLLNEDHFDVRKIDVEAEVAWKAGYFRFDDEPLESIMRKISRWYDVEVVFLAEDLKTELYAAMTTRFEKVSKLLDMLEQTGEAQFSIEERRIIITKKEYR